MDYRLTWDEAKRRTNLLKHGLDFADAAAVLESQYRMDTSLLRNGELRVQSVSYALGFLAVLTVVPTARGDKTRVISFCRASREERETYYAWLEEDQ